MLLTHLNVYLGKQERGERGNGGMGERGKGSSPQLAVSIQANIQVTPFPTCCCILVGRPGNKTT